MGGLVFVGAEIFVPGGFLGTIGGFSLIGAIVIAYIAFNTTIASYITLGIMALTALAIYAWSKYFPKTFIGKKMFISDSLKDYRGIEDGLDKLIGKEGTAMSDLRPGGFALIDGKRIDVVTQGEMINKNETIRVLDTQSNRVIVT
ncbi:MAG: NfeD family protein, partial [Verrucomicrobiota bacterium]